MNCNVCRYELSQCLDGRLPSGRRTLVLQHAESCSACNQFWSELQAAQQLSLRLRTTCVEDGFRERLWQRIRAGEGTPEAVFHEPIPLVTKLRYALTGAAAAAAALLAVTMFHKAAGEPEARTNGTQPLANVDRTVPQTGPVYAAPDYSPQDYAAAAPMAQQVSLASLPLAATQPLTFNLFANETARQLEQRHAAVATALRQIENPRGNRDSAIHQAFENAADFCAFGEILIDLVDRDRLQFTDSRFDSDLRVAVSMLKIGQEAAHDLHTVQTLVAPALRSERLGRVCKVITVPLIDQREDTEVLRRLSHTRPDVFPKLFFVVGNVVDLRDDLGNLPVGLLFQLEDACGASLVAPRSEVEARKVFLQTLRQLGR